MNELKLHDIKGLIEIPDYSLYLLLGLMLLVVILLFSILLYLYKWLRRKKVNIRKQSYTILTDMDFSNSKNAAYLITKHGRIIAKGQREKRLLENLIYDLEQYKYKKEILAINKKTQLLFEQFMESVDV
jgi:hypothetical protein